MKSFDVYPTSSKLGELSLSDCAKIVSVARNAQESGAVAIAVRCAYTNAEDDSYGPRLQVCTIIVLWRWPIGLEDPFWGFRNLEDWINALSESEGADV